MVRNENMRSGLRWIWVAVLVVILDRITKTLALKNLMAYTPVKVMPFFNLTLAYNKGAAFSFLNSASGWQTWMFGGIAIGMSVILLIWLSKISVKQKWVSVALCFIIGGALGNLWDRLMYGHVIDFIQWYVGEWYWPVFNIADSAICVGATMLLLDAVFCSRHSPESLSA